MSRPTSARRAATVYLLLAGLQRGVSFLILPLISHAMLPDEYGAASILTASALLLVAVFAPIEPLVFRAATQSDIRGPRVIQALGTYCYALLPVMIGTVAALVAMTGPHLLGIPAKMWAIELLATGFLPAATAFALPLTRARHDLRRFAVIAAVSVAVTAVSKIVLVVTLDLGVLGWAIADLLSAVLSAAVAAALVRLPRVALSKADVRSAISFCLPLIPHRASFWALSFLSRPALAAVSTLGEVGLLSFGVNISLVANLVIAEVNQAVLPNYARETLPAPSEATREIAIWQTVLAFAAPASVSAGLALFGPTLFAMPYWPSFPSTGILLAGQVALGIYTVLMSYIVFAGNLPAMATVASTSGAAVTIAGVIVAGRPYGAAGAAYASALGFFIMAAVAYILIRALKLDVNFRNLRKSWLEIAIAVLSMAVSLVALHLQTGSRVSSAAAALSILLALVSIGIRYHRSRDRPSLDAQSA